MLSPTIQKNPAWLTRAKTILIRLEADDVNSSNQTSIIRQSIERLSLQIIACQARLDTLTKSARQPDNSFSNSQQARDQISVQIENVNAEISELDAEIVFLKQRFETASIAASLAAGIYQKARAAYHKIIGGAPRSAVGAI